MEYCQGKHGEYAEIIPFINEVFGEDFPVILPKTYGPGKHFEEYHQLVKEDGVLTAVIGNYEQDFYIGNTVLKTGCVGSVSVSKQARGKGYMQLLMKKTEEAMRAHQVDIAFLGGLRNRYGFFGFEKSGFTYEFYFNEANIRQTVGWDEDTGVEIRLVTADDPALDELYALYRKNVMWCRSREEFYEKSHTWNHEVFQIRLDGVFAGYFAAKGGCIVELELSDWSNLLRVVKACMIKNNEKSLSVQVLGWQIEQLTALFMTCESYHLRTCCAFKILNYVNTITALLELKKTYTKLEDGTLLLGIKPSNQLERNFEAMPKSEIEEKHTEVLKPDEAGLNKKENILLIQITVEHGNITVMEVQEGTPTLVLTDREAAAVLMSPAGTFYARNHQLKLKNWFPVEFSISNLDEF